VKESHDSVIPAKAGIQSVHSEPQTPHWIPAFAGMTSSVWAFTRWSDRSGIVPQARSNRERMTKHYFIESLCLLFFIALAQIAAAAASGSSSGTEMPSTEVVREKDAKRIALSPGPLPEPGKPGKLAFQIRAPWMKGAMDMRFPETLDSSLGLHFIDHFRADMPPLYKLEPFPAWVTDPSSGKIRYQCKTPDGMEFGGQAVPGDTFVEMEFWVKNGTVKPVERFRCQMCFVLSDASGFTKRDDLSPVFAWVDGKFTSLAKTTPTPKEKGRRPWVLMQTKSQAKEYSGPRDYHDGWWVVDQLADYGLIARVSEDRRYLAAIAWDAPPFYLMTNTMIPCLHAGPTNAFSLQPGEKAVWRGKIYLMPNDPGLLLSRYREDFEERKSTGRSTQ